MKRERNTLWHKNITRRYYKKILLENIKRKGDKGRWQERVTKYIMTQKWTT